MNPDQKHELHQEFPWLDWLDDVAKEVIHTLHGKEVHYRGSWQKRGGPGAFMMLGRKWDRIEAICEKHGYDIFAAIRENDGDIGDDIDDLIGYLLLVRAESRRRAGTTEYTSQKHKARSAMEEDLYGYMMKKGRNSEGNQ